jgi:hypothetical protein
MGYGTATVTERVDVGVARRYVSELSDGRLSRRPIM